MLVREAINNLDAELRNNQKELNERFPALQNEQRQLEHLDALTDIVLAGKPLANQSFSLQTNGAELNSY